MWNVLKRCVLHVTGSGLLDVDGGTENKTELLWTKWLMVPTVRSNTKTWLFIYLT